MITNKPSVKILAFGMEKVGFLLPKDNPIFVSNGIEVKFGEFKTQDKFQDYDGVVIPQGIWATKEVRHNVYAGSENFIKNIQQDEMSKRIKQLQILLKKGGFICFLMDRMNSDDYDLAKTILNWFPNTYFNEIPNAHFLNSMYGELNMYFETYGVAKTSYSHYGEDDYRVLAKIDEVPVSICFDQSIYFIPYHCPDISDKDTENLFKSLIPALVSVFKKLNQEVPKWVNEFIINKENVLKEELQNLSDKLDKTQKEFDGLMELKKILSQSGESLRMKIGNIFNKYLELNVDTNETWKEDFRIYNTNEQGKTEIIGLVETKGVNENVSRENINQVDTHRSRNNLLPTIPGILIMNTFMKYSSISDKDKSVNDDQVKHAVKMNVLILRTLDLMRAINIILDKPNRIEEFQHILLTKNGWCEVNDNSFIIHI